MTCDIYSFTTPLSIMTITLISVLSLLCIYYFSAGKIAEVAKKNINSNDSTAVTSPSTPDLHHTGLCSTDGNEGHGKDASSSDTDSLHKDSASVTSAARHDEGTHMRG